MGTGYTRNDVSNNIADGNIINAADLDGEFDAVESAFNSSTGHTHDGTAAEGGAITVVGPVQDLVVSATEVKPKTTNTLDLGTSALLYKDAYLQGNMYFRDTALKIVSSADGQLDIDADVELELVAPTVDIDASTAVTIDTATLTITGSANVVGDLDIDNININGNTIISTDTNGNIALTPNGTGEVDISKVDIDSGAIDGTVIGASSAAAITGTTITGTSFVSSGDMTFGDSDKAIFGAGSDLEISHDGTNSFITDVGTGDLFISGSTVKIRASVPGAEDGVTVTGDGAVTLYYDNSPKLATTSSGIDVTGEVQADSLDIDGVVDIDGATTITVTGNSAALTLESTDDDADLGPLLTMYRNSATPDDNDLIGHIQFTAEDSIGNPTVYSSLQSRIRDVTNGTEDGELKIEIRNAGSNTETLTLKPEEVVFNEAGVDQDFRVESNGADYMLFVDGGNNRVGIGESAPQVPLHVTWNNSGEAVRIESTDSGGGSGPTIGLYRNSSSPTDGDSLGGINFYGEDSVGNITTYAAIDAEIYDVTNGTEDGRLHLKNQVNGTLTSRIYMNTGETVVNEGSADLDFRVETNNANYTLFVDGGNDVVNIRTSTNFGGGLNVNGGLNSKQAVFSSTNNRGLALLTATRGGQNDGVGIVDAQDTDGTGGRLELHTAGAERARFENSGIVFNESSADADFRVEGNNNSYLLFVDAGDDRVAINTSTPRTLFDVNGQASFNAYTQITKFNSNNDVIGFNCDIDDSTGNITPIYTGASSASGSFIHMKAGGDGTMMFRANGHGTTATDYLYTDAGLYLTLDPSGLTSGSFVVNDNSTDIDFRVESNGNAAMLFVDAGNDKVGIGTAAPSNTLEVSTSDVFGGITISGANAPGLTFNDTTDAAYCMINTQNAGDLRFYADQSDVGASTTMEFHIDGSEAARFDSSRNWLVGKTSTGSTVRGSELRDGTSGFVATFRTDADGVSVDRSNTAGDGVCYYLRREGTTRGTIFTINNNSMAIGSGNVNLRFNSSGGADYIIPVNSSGADRDNVVDLGFSGARFDDIYATNGTIQTSDANEKQQVASLTDAEITAAKAISQLFKTFKWNSAVDEKGDAARTHTGVIAQEVEAAMTAAGLNAGDYAFFISNTWWETQTEVPAVEADEANDVEAKEAYTHTQTYHTAEEAPEGAVERTRLGIRYPELLAFIGAATEQRLANIETRLAALEAN